MRRNRFESYGSDLMKMFGSFGVFLFGVAVALVFAGCPAGKKTTEPRPVDESPEPEYSVEHVQEEEPGDGLQIEGMLGTIDERVVSREFARKNYDIEQCILGNVRAMPYVNGNMNFHFDVDAEGVVTVKVLENTIGNHLVEECLLKVAESLDFGKPKGGSAKVDYPLSIPARGDAPETWAASRVRKEIKRNMRAINKCKKNGEPNDFTLYFYILPGGRMTSLGVFARNGVPDGFASCVFDALKDVTFPDTFGNVAKVEYKF